MRVLLTSRPLWSHLVPVVAPVGLALQAAGHTVAVAAGTTLDDERAQAHSLDQTLDVTTAGLPADRPLVLATLGSNTWFTDREKLPLHRRIEALGS